MSKRSNFIKDMGGIQDSKQALRLSKNLSTVWSRETLLTQRILIQVLNVLEQINKKGIRKKRLPTKWQKHLKKYLSNGKTIQEAAFDWNKFKKQ